MKITWLGQAGLMFEFKRKILLVDPYLSDSVSKVDPDKHRRFEVDKKFLSVKPDYILLTHNHLDHTDTETLQNYLLRNEAVTVLASGNAWKNVRRFGGNNNYVLFDNGTTWSEHEVKCRAVYAEHSDEHAIGVIITVEDKNYYVTGDTLYNERVFKSLPAIKFYAVFLPINGEGNNMNKLDAALFATRIKAEHVVPIHFGMFDDINARDFLCDRKIIPQIYLPLKFSKDKT